MKNRFCSLSGPDGIKDGLVTTDVHKSFFFSHLSTRQPGDLSTHGQMFGHWYVSVI